MKRRAAIATVLVIMAPTLAWAHPGRTDANGCHTNKKTSEYHCHGAPATTSARTDAPVAARETARATSPSVEPSAAVCNFDLYNCSDFASGEKAQATFLVCGGINKDIHQLDKDNDGLACEELSN
ncbi:MAG: YHYH domain-containing protein [Patescibacteria group bacterium]|jgi:hypothetical protein